ncbi:glycoside hydrolase family 11 protein [Seiridium cupressi]
MVHLSHLALAVSAIAGVFAGPTADLDAPNFVIGPANLARRQDYNQNYETSGTVNFSPTNNGYSVNFSGAGDFVVGKGWSTGTTRNITFSGSTTHSSGTVLVSVYGWSKNPLVEYYIQEYASDGKGSAQGTQVGTVESDGSVYDIWEHTQVNQPSIVGTTTFTQYISNRRTSRPGSGTVTTKNHFDAWAKLGLPLGTMDYQVLATEGWGSAGGNSQYTIST